MISKDEIQQSLSQSFAIPPDADADHAKIDKQKDSIVITLPKLPA